MFVYHKICQTEEDILGYQDHKRIMEKTRDEIKDMITVWAQRYAAAHEEKEAIISTLQQLPDHLIDSVID